MNSIAEYFPSFFPHVICYSCSWVICSPCFPDQFATEHHKFTVEVALYGCRRSEQPAMVANTNTTTTSNA